MTATIFISPHLDDAALSCGGAISRLASAGCRVTVATVCTADPPEGRVLSAAARRFHASWALGDRPFAARRDEDADALRRLGADHLHLGFVDAVYRTDDGGEPLYPRRVSLGLHPDDAEVFLDALRDPLRRALEASACERVFCPTGVGGHVDHILVRRAVEALCEPERVVYYEEYPYLSRRSAPPDCAHDSDRISPTVLALAEPELGSRIAAIACYRSQLRGLFPSRTERVAEVLSARVPVVGPYLRGPDAEPPLKRVERHVRRDVAAFGGERYWWLPSAGSPFE